MVFCLIAPICGILPPSPPGIGFLKQENRLPNWFNPRVSHLMTCQFLGKSSSYLSILRMKYPKPIMCEARAIATYQRLRYRNACFEASGQL
jgi:hypothetical protein